MEKEVVVVEMEEEVEMDTVHMKVFFIFHLKEVVVVMDKEVEVETAPMQVLLCL